jgi:hypothetical protein
MLAGMTASTRRRAPFAGFAALTLALAFPPSLRAQQPDPSPQPVLVETRLADGTRMPAVPVLRRGVLALEGPARSPDDGWLRASSDALEPSRWVVAGRTDPDGRLTLLANGGELPPLAVGAPFRLAGQLREGDRELLTVERLEQFVVAVRDVDGKPLPGVPMTLRQDQEPRYFAITDAQGRATFGVEPETTVRLVVVPFGWIGPVDDFPTFAKQLPDRVQPFTLPPFGTVRVRLLARGVPKELPIAGATVQVAGFVPLQFDGNARARWHGLELGPVAVGQSAKGTLRTADGGPRFASPPITRHGEVVVVDVELEPARPELALRVVVPGLVPPDRERGERRQLPRVNLRVVTDQGSASASPELGTDGRVVAPMHPLALRGTRIVRVDADVIDVATSLGVGGIVREERMWSGTLAVDRAIAAERLDLGTIELAPHAGLLRGRVVDETGASVVRARVDVAGADARAGSVGTATAEDGTFAIASPLLRGADGAPQRVIATASLGDGRDAVHGEPSAPLEPGSDVTLVLRRPARGFVTVSLRERDRIGHALHFTWKGADGRVLDVDRDRVRWVQPRSSALELGPLPAGRGELTVLLRPGVRLRTFPDVEVRAGETTTDQRLLALDLSDVVRPCRVRVVDEHGVPIAGAFVQYRGASSGVRVGPSDGTGMLDVVAGPPGGLTLTISAPGKQPRELGDIRDGADVRLSPVLLVCVTVQGLPAEVPRERVEVVLRSVVRENLEDTVFGRLGAGDAVSVPQPRAGRYVVHLQVNAERANGGTSSWGVGTIGELQIDRDGTAPATFVLDAATIARVRDVLARPK